MRNWNRHHVIFQRASYKTSVEREFRNHKGLLVPMSLSEHGDLHHRIQPPPKPSRGQILGAVAFLDTLGPELDNPPEAVELLAVHFMEQQNNLAKRIGKNLLAQLTYIDRGYVDLRSVA